MKVKTLALLAVAFVVVAFLAACGKKNSASIVGTWTGTTFHQELVRNNVVIYDTTIDFSQNVVQFRADGYLYDYANQQARFYNVNQNILTLTDTNAAHSVSKFKLITLTDHALALQNSDTIGTATSDSIGRFTLNFSR